MSGDNEMIGIIWDVLSGIMGKSHVEHRDPGRDDNLIGDVSGYIIGNDEKNTHRIHVCYIYICTLYMVTLTIKIPQMLAYIYIPYMDPSWDMNKT